ncbi:MAG: hypothetical protein J3Q66DRAFT_397458 [Benniella sp.]|nr:MAG: hypothetical protein J3Q66DRAFT_397458 [Benniella sp.]
MMANKDYSDHISSVATAAAVELPASPQLDTDTTITKTPHAPINRCYAVRYERPTLVFLSDITLDLDDVMFGSPKEPTPATTVSVMTEALTTPMDMTRTITTDMWPSNTTTEIQFALDSPIHEIEMQQFCNDPRLSSAVKSPFPGTNQSHPHRQQPQQQQQQGSSSLFTGFFAIPPSLAGRPRLTEEQEDYVRREHQRGPVPLMWPKEDLEIQRPEALQSKSTGGWFGG